jgi:hypothetical protein
MRAFFWGFAVYILAASMSRSHRLKTSMTLTRTALACAGLCVGLAHAAVPIAAAPATAAQPAPSPAQLAALAFPGWSEGQAARYQTVSVAEAEVAHGGFARWVVNASRVRVDPKLVLRLDASHLTLIAGLAPANEDGQPVTAHNTPLGLAAYQFELRGAAWSLTRRQGVFAMRGFFGEAAVRAVALSNGRQGVALEYGSCWQGYCGTWLSLYEADGPAMRTRPAVELTLSGHNENAALDCSRRLQPLVKMPAQDTALRDDGARPEGHDCYAIEGSWAIEARDGQDAHDGPGDLVLHYQGAMSRAGAHAAPPVAIDQRQVLRYGGGRYRAVSGFDPVPPI